MKESTRDSVIGGSISGAVIAAIVSLGIFGVRAIFGAGSIAQTVSDDNSAINHEIKPALKSMTDKVSRLAERVGTLEGGFATLSELLERQRVSALAAKALPAIASAPGKKKAIGTLESFDPATLKATIRTLGGERQTYSVAHDTKAYVCPSSEAGCTRLPELSSLKPGDAVAFRYAPSDSQIDRVYTVPSVTERAYVPPLLK
jgi:hypothetical protein